MKVYTISNSRHVISNEFNDISSWMSEVQIINNKVVGWPGAQCASEDTFITLVGEGFVVGREIVGFCPDQYQDYVRAELTSICIDEEILYNKEKLFKEIKQNTDMAHFQWVKINHNDCKLSYYLEYFC